MADAPATKFPPKGTYLPVPPYTMFRGGSEAMRREGLEFQEAIDTFVRYGLAPNPAYRGAAIQDDNGVVVLGWFVSGDDIKWVGVRAFATPASEHELVHPLLALDILKVIGE